MATRIASHPAAHRFGAEAPFSLGVEEELLVVDPRDLRLVREPAPLPSSGHGTVCPELCDAMLELVTPICRTAGEAHDALAAIRADVEAAGVALLGAGLHPDGAFGDARHREEERYAAIDAAIRGLARRTPFCGVHVHVGLPDPDTAILACNGMRKWIPMLQALAGSSPFWHGRDSGLASARRAVIRALPRSGVPRAFRDYEDFLGVVEQIFAAGELDDYTMFWWDLRPHPRLGTLELRAVDAQASLRDLVGLVALIHCLVVREATVPAGEDPPPEALDESCFRAMRDGRAAVLHLGGRLRPLAEVVETALRLAAPHARALGCLDELHEVRRILVEGNGADRQRAAHARGGMVGLLAALRVETQAGLPQAGAPVAPAPAPVLSRAA